MGGDPMKIHTNTIRFLFCLIGLSILMAACTPAATPKVDIGQEEQAPTLTLSATETPPPTETLTPTATAIPPTPTFPAPEGADLPDSAARSVNEQGQEVILDQPDGVVLWTLIEDDSGDLIWQEIPSELEPGMAELQTKIEAHLKQQTAESAKHLAAYLNKHVQGNVGFIDFHDEELGSFEVGWHVEKQRWVQITEDNDDQIDRTLDSSFPPIFAAGRVENDQDVFTGLDGEEVVLEREMLPYIGEVSLAELVLMGRKNELSYDGKTGLNLAEYVSLLMKGADFPGPKGEDYTRTLIDKYSAPFALATRNVQMILDN
jgi:hypothetical protein